MHLLPIFIRSFISRLSTRHIVIDTIIPPVCTGWAACVKALPGDDVISLPVGFGKDALFSGGERNVALPPKQHPEQEGSRCQEAKLPEMQDNEHRNHPCITCEFYGNGIDFFASVQYNDSGGWRQDQPSCAKKRLPGSAPANRGARPRVMRNLKPT